MCITRKTGLQWEIIFETNPISIRLVSVVVPVYIYQYLLSILSSLFYLVTAHSILKLIKSTCTGPVSCIVVTWPVGHPVLSRRRTELSPSLDEATRWYGSTSVSSATERIFGIHVLHAVLCKVILIYLSLLLLPTK